MSGAGDYRIEPISARLRTSAHQRGPLPTAGALLGWGAAYAAGLPATAARPRRRFRFQGRDYRYLVHRHQHTWLGERAVEVPIARAAIREAGPGPVLEVGHVLGHYHPVDHEVLDKYERAPGVRNLDVLELSAERPYRLIVSVSTLEHVGFDDAPRDPGAAVAAVGHLRAMLGAGGRLLATIPVGYNPGLIRAIATGRAGFDEVAALRRTGPGMRWSEVPVPDVLELPYDRLLYRAPAVLICTAAA